MNRKFEYEAILIRGPQIGTYIEFPFDSYKEFGTRKPVPVKVSFDDYKTEMNLLPHGKNHHWLHVRKEIRDAIGKQEGDTVKVTVEKNNFPVSAPIPEYLKWLLDDEPEMKKAFEKVPPSARKFWIGAIEEVKNEDVKVERINRFFEFLRQNYSG